MLKFFLMFVTLIAATACSTLNQGYGNSMMVHYGSNIFIDVFKTESINKTASTSKTLDLKNLETRESFTWDNGSNVKVSLLFQETESIQSCSAIDYERIERGFYDTFDSSYGSRIHNNIKINLVIMEDANFQIEEEISHKDGEYSVTLYYALTSCAEISKELHSAMHIALHEIYHVDFYIQGHAETLTRVQDEYWAQRLSYCDFISSEAFSGLQFRGSELNKEDMDSIRRYTTSSNATVHGTQLFHYDIYLVNGRLDYVDADPPQEVYDWCGESFY